MSVLKISKPDKNLLGEITLDGSKSISNRALIITALAGARPADWLTNLSTSRDTQTLLQLLENQNDTYDAGDAGTTFRFLTAYLSTRPGEHILTGSERMQQRPVGPLVAALRELGADIVFLKNEGFPPLKIRGVKNLGLKNRVIQMPADTSSQFLSALLLIAPTLPNGLELRPQGTLVSRPYLEMTLRSMRFFGAKIEWQGDSILIQPVDYQLKKLKIEADWSAASYWYAMAAFAEKVDLKLLGLGPESLQGDAVLAPMMRQFGVETTFENDGIRLLKTASTPRPIFEKDFLDCPDLAQTLAVVCAGLGVQGIFSGLETLTIKETDRIAALKNELKKVGVTFSKLPAHFSKKQPDKKFYLLEKNPSVGVTPSHSDTQPQLPRFATYGDHRMAMAFAPLAFLGPVEVENSEVVAKSYPRFWEDLQRVGFQLNHL